MPSLEDFTTVLTEITTQNGFDDGDHKPKVLMTGTTNPMVLDDGDHKPKVLYDGDHKPEVLDDGDPTQGFV